MKKFVPHAIIVTAALVIGCMRFTGPKEGEILVPYDDGGGVATVCSGHTGKDIDLHHVMTHHECQKILERDVTDRLRQLRYYVKVPVTMPVAIAMQDFLFNVGSGNFRNSEPLRLLNEGKTREACLAFMGYASARAVPGSADDLRDGKEDGKRDCRIKENRCLGILTRRQDERDMCLSGI